MYRAVICIAFLLASTSVLSDNLLINKKYRYLASDQVVNLGEAYKGKVVMVVNTASKCGLTKQYEGLETMYAAYRPRGLVILGFPSNDFMGQEPGTEQEIQEFCTLTYGVKFPMFEKVKVRGARATPLFKELTKMAGEGPGWNFHKYLIDRNGKFAASFSSRTTPDDEALLAKIEKLLEEKPVPGNEASLLPVSTTTTQRVD